MTRGSTCRDLDTIQYKSALIAGETCVRGSQSKSKIDDVIQEYTSSPDATAKSWSRLGVTEKVVLLKAFTTTYRDVHSLDESVRGELEEYLILALSSKRLAKASDVDYCRKTGSVTGIPLLTYNRSTKKFTMSRALVFFRSVDC